MSTPTKPPDEALARQAAEGLRSAFEQLVERYGGAVLAVLEKRLGDHHAALDLTQEAWVRVFRALGRFDPEQSFRSWLFAIVLNAARDERRRRERSQVVYIDDFRSAAAPDEVATLERSDDRAAIEATVARVPDPFRTALVLVDLEGLSYEEAARSLNCAIGTVKSRVNRGRLSFRDLWTRVSGESASARLAGECS